MKIWRGRVLWRGYVHPHTHTHAQSIREFPVKTRTGSGNTHENGFICHLYILQSQTKLMFIAINKVPSMLKCDCSENGL